MDTLDPGNTLPTALFIPLLENARTLLVRSVEELSGVALLILSAFALCLPTTRIAHAKKPDMSTILLARVASVEFRLEDSVTGQRVLGKDQIQNVTIITAFVPTETAIVTPRNHYMSQLRRWSVD